MEKTRLQKIIKTLKLCGPLFFGLGDEARQKLIIDIAEAGEEGINVTQLSKKSELSRPAVSHHLKVLKDCGLVVPKKKGTQIFYELTLNDNLTYFSEFIKSIETLIEAITPKK